MNEFKGCCSAECMNAPRKRIEKKEEKVLGIVENFYEKNKVVMLKLVENIEYNTKVKFFGNTTESFEQTISQMRDYDENEILIGLKGHLITVPVSGKVRKHDKMALV